MANRHFNPWDVLVQLETDLMRSSESAMRAVLFHPCVDMYETDDALLIKMELAGVPAENLNITIASDDRSLTIAGKRTEPTQDRNRRLRCYQLEIYYGSFERQIMLPSDIAIDRDQVAAHYRDGFLVIELPKRKDIRGEKRVIEVTKD